MYPMPDTKAKKVNQVCGIISWLLSLLPLLPLQL